MKAARLNSSLLIRKGSASPVSSLTPYAEPPAGHETLDREVADAPRSTVAAVTTGPRGQGTVRAVRDRDTPLVRDHHGRVRLSLRLDPHRHLRLKLLAAHSHRSIQEILIHALDAYMEDQGQSMVDGSCACLMETDQVPPADCDKPCHAKAKDAEG
jgi:hypothetical protein